MSNETLDTRPGSCAQAIEGMALTFDPEEAGDLDAVIQFYVSGDGGGDWYLVIKDGQCRCERGVTAEATLTITTPDDVWLAIARKELGGTRALLTRKYTAKGKPGLLMKLDKIFSRQPTKEEIAAKGWLEGEE